MRYEKLSEKIQEMEAEILEAVQESVAINSVKGEAKEDAPYGEGPKAALEHALALGEKLGFRTKNVGNRVGWIEYGEGEEMVAVLGHLDVVPLGQGWIYPPLGGEIHDGVLYGRGVADDKGPTIGAFYALKAIRELGLPLERRIRVIFGTDEENGSSCVKYYKEQGEEIPASGFTPDAEYPCIFCEKGMSRFRLGKKMVNGGNSKVLFFQGGTAANVVTPKCTLLVEGTLEVSETPGITVTEEAGRTKILAEGRSAHGSTPQLGENAAVKLLETVSDMNFGGDFQQMEDFILEMLGRETNGKTLGIYYKDDQTGETTVNLGVVQYSPEGMELSLDIRYPKNGSAKEVEEQVRKAAQKYQLEVLECETTPMLYMPIESELIQKLMHVYHEITGREEQPLAIGGGTYAKAFPNMVAFGPAFPGDPETVHQPNECISVKTLMESLKLTGAAMWELAGSDH